MDTGKGIYTEITTINAPDRASENATVHVEIRIKNFWSNPLHIYCVGVWDSEQRYIDWLDAWLEPEQVASFSGSFIMPSRNVIAYAYSYFEATDGYLYLDDSTSRQINLEIASRQINSEITYRGRISRKELEYNESRATIPVR